MLTACHGHTVSMQHEQSDRLIGDGLEEVSRFTVIEDVTSRTVQGRFGIVSCEKLSYDNRKHEFESTKQKWTLGCHRDTGIAIAERAPSSTLVWRIVLDLTTHNLQEHNRSIDRLRQP